MELFLHISTNLAKLEHHLWDVIHAHLRGNKWTRLTHLATHHKQCKVQKCSNPFSSFSINSLFTFYPMKIMIWRFLEMGGPCYLNPWWLGDSPFFDPPAWLWVKTQRYPSQTVPVLSCRWYSWMFMNPQSYPYGSSRTFWKEVFGIYFTLIWKLFCTFSDRVWIHSAIGYGNFIGLWSHPHIITGWWLTYPSEKYEFVSWDYYSQYIYMIYIYYIYIWKNKKCSKPPTRSYSKPMIELAKRRSCSFCSSSAQASAAFS